MKDTESCKNVCGKTPEEIKKSLKTAINGCMLRCGSCNEKCSYDYYCGPVNVFQHATAIPKIMVDDALALIEQLERERDQYKRERDAAIIELRGYGCEQCVHSDLKNIATVCCNCKLGSLWEWQGVKEEKNNG